MAGFRRICCPTDFSDPARRALDRALAIGIPENSELTLLHVDDPLRAGVDVAFAPPYGAVEDAGATTLARWKADAEKRLQRTVQAVSLAGPAAQTIVDFAREKEIDLLVLASHGKGSFEKRVLGRVTEQVVRLAPCDVLVIRSEPPPRSAHRPDVGADVPL